MFAYARTDQHFNYIAKKITLRMPKSVIKYMKNRKMIWSIDCFYKPMVMKISWNMYAIGVESELREIPSPNP